MLRYGNPCHDFRKNGMAAPPPDLRNLFGERPARGQWLAAGPASLVSQQCDGSPPAHRSRGEVPIRCMTRVANTPQVGHARVASAVTTWTTLRPSSTTLRR